MSNEIDKEGLIELTRDSFEENRINLRSLQYDISPDEYAGRMEKLNQAEHQIVALIKSGNE